MCARTYTDRCLYTYLCACSWCVRISNSSHFRWGAGQSEVCDVTASCLKQFQPFRIILKLSRNILVDLIFRPRIWKQVAISPFCKRKGGSFIRNCFSQRNRSAVDLLTFRTFCALSHELMQWSEDIDSAHPERTKFGCTLLLMPSISLET